MENRFLDLAELYFSGPLSPRGGNGSIDPAIAAFARQFFWQFDDYYHDYFGKEGRNPYVRATMALNKIGLVASQENLSHMPLCYAKCGISSGTNPHLDAVASGYHTTDRVARRIGSDRHLQQNILDNSNRAQARSYKFQLALPDRLIVNPTSFEGGTRVIGKSGGLHLTGGLPFDSAQYMAFWFPTIDSVKAAITDDPCVDAPGLERLEHELAWAKGLTPYPPARRPIVSTDWANSRNSNFEAMRELYIAFGLHPLRPDAGIDIRRYDEATGRTYPMRLIDAAKPLAQAVLRWSAQGIAAVEAVRCLSKMFQLHRLRTDPHANAALEAPIPLATINPLYGNPRQDEIRDFAALIAGMEPYLLEYCGHLINPMGLPDDYRRAKERAAVQAKRIGPDSVKWQRQTIPAQRVADLWPLTVSAAPNPALACSMRPPKTGTYMPQRRRHDFTAQPFQTKADEIWPDRPYDLLDGMEQEMARFLIGVLGLGILPADAQDYRGLRYDMKRGRAALGVAEKNGIRNLAHLPGALGRNFNGSVKAANMAEAARLLDNLRTGAGRPGCAPAVAFGTPVMASIRDAYQKISGDLIGYGPDLKIKSLSSTFALALELEMMRQHYTEITFQDGWETSDDSARFMLQATKLQLGKVARPGGNDTELRVLDQQGAPISFYQRYDALRRHLNRLAANPAIATSRLAGDADALQDCGVRHASIALARLIEIYDCLKDPLHNQNRFELQRVHQDSLGAFARDLDRVQTHKREAAQSIRERWVWLWTPDDFSGLPQDYRDAWLHAQSRLQRQAGPLGTDDQAIKNGFSPS